jgi:hypothetical protein
MNFVVAGEAIGLIVVPLPIRFSPGVLELDGDLLAFALLSRGHEDTNDALQTACYDLSVSAHVISLMNLERPHQYPVTNLHVFHERRVHAVRIR